MPKRRRAITSPERVRKQYLSTRLALRGLSQGRSVKAGLKSLVRTESIMGLLDKAVYPKEMHPETLREMQNFVHDWLNKRARLEIDLDLQAKAIAKRERVSEIKAYGIALEENRQGFEKRLAEKAALEQLLFVMNRQRVLKAQGKKIDPVKPGKTVREFGSHYLDQKRKPESFQRMVEAVSRIPLIGTHPKIAEAYYGLPTAEETLLTGRIITIVKKQPTWGVKGSYEEVPVWGCGMQCDVINAVLNLWGWENYHVRTKNNVGYPHSVVLTKAPLKGKNFWLVADPFMNGYHFVARFEKFQGSRVVAQVGQVLGDYIRRLEVEGNWMKGRSLKSHVKNFVEYQGEL